MELMDVYLQWSFVLKIMKSYGQGKPLNGKPLAESLENQTKSSIDGLPEAPEDQYEFEIPKDYLLSPYWAPDEILSEFPRTRVVSLTMDPCLDENIDFSKKLKQLNVDVQIDILGRLPHGFLLFCQVKEPAHVTLVITALIDFFPTSLFQTSKECNEASLHCIQRLSEFFQMTSLGFLKVDEHFKAEKLLHRLQISIYTSSGLNE